MKAIDKLLKAVNVVCFEKFCVRAKVARFDRSASTMGKKTSDADGASARGGTDGEGGSKNVWKRQMGKGEK